MTNHQLMLILYQAQLAVEAPTVNKTDLLSYSGYCNNELETAELSFPYTEKPDGTYVKCIQSQFDRICKYFRDRGLGLEALQGIRITLAYSTNKLGAVKLYYLPQKDVEPKAIDVVIPFGVKMRLPHE